MATAQILCLANSTKHNGRCVAGVRLDSHEWIRPVSSAEDGTLSATMCTLDVGREARPLDVIEIDLARARPERHQPENWVIGAGPWRLIEEWSVTQASEVLEPLRELGPAVLGGTTSRIPVADIEESPVESSLAVVRVSAPRFVLNPYDTSKLRARFSVSDQFYDLSVRDRAAWVDTARSQLGTAPRTNWYLTISLTEPFAATQACHKLVAAGMEISSQTA